MGDFLQNSSYPESAAVGRIHDSFSQLPTGHAAAAKQYHCMHLILISEGNIFCYIFLTRFPQCVVVVVVEDVGSGF